MPVNAPDFEYVRDLLRNTAAIVLDPGKEYLVETRLEPLALSEGFSTLGSMVSALRQGSVKGLQNKVVERMTTNETSFFRDLYPFDALRRTILPELIARRAQERTLNIWCGACSSGQEPYSIMMLLRDAFPSLGISHSSRPTSALRCSSAHAREFTRSSKSTAACPRRCW